MKNSMHMNTLLQVTVLVASLLAAGCAQAVAKSTEQINTIDVKKDADTTKVVLVSNGDSKTLSWNTADLADPAAIAKAVSEVPAEQREQIKQILTQINAGKGFEFTTDGTDKLTVHQLGHNATDVKVLTGKKVIMHKIVGGDGSEFGLLKSLLQETQLNKTQLQELQKILDAKH